ncbi:MAG: tetratricopeptide (TPR) repeat protein, partial [Gammaproteobacteria bacterium]
DGGVYVINPLLHDCLNLSFSLLTITEQMHIHSVVVTWYIQHENLSMALHYAKLAGKSELFAKIVNYFGPTSMATQQGATAVKSAMSNIPVSTIRSSARLTIAQGFVLIKDGQFSMAIKKLAEAYEMLTDDVDKEENGHLSAMTDYISTQYLLALYKNENFNREYLDRCEIETFQHSGHDGTIGFIHALKSLLHQRRACFPQAFAEADRSLAYYKIAKSNYGIASIQLIIGLCFFAKGQLELALRSYVRAQRIINKYFADDPGLNAIAETLVAEINYERNKVGNQPDPLNPRSLHWKPMMVGWTLSWRRIESQPIRLSSKMIMKRHK